MGQHDRGMNDERRAIGPERVLADTNKHSERVLLSSILRETIGGRFSFARIKRGILLITANSPYRERERVTIVLVGVEKIIMLGESEREIGSVKRVQ